MMDIDTESSQVTIRSATPDDIQIMVDLIKALAAYQGQQKQVSVTSEDLRRDGFGPNPKFECVLAELDDRAVGLAIFHPTYSTWEGATGVYVDDLFVDESVRGQRVGHKLIKEVARRTSDKGGSYLALNVVHANPARNFYDRFGFNHVDDLLTYRLSGARLDNLINS